MSDMSHAVVSSFVAGISGIAIGMLIGRAPAPRAPKPIAPESRMEARCKAERAELTSTKAQLAICMAYTPHSPEVDTPAVEVEDTEEAIEAARVRRNRDVMATCPDFLVVRQADGTMGLFPPDEWPSDGDGIIVARRLPSGQIGWYAGPDAGPRSDPAAFRAWFPMSRVSPRPI
jgi:hypothetical protein